VGGGQGRSCSALPLMHMHQGQKHLAGVH
jgi:hypothetical protein